jgi:hypothetical protein
LCDYHVQIFYWHNNYVIWRVIIIRTWNGDLDNLRNRMTAYIVASRLNTSSFHLLPAYLFPGVFWWSLQIFTSDISSSTVKCNKGIHFCLLVKCARRKN